jgi:hypothetical protein
MSQVTWATSLGHGLAGAVAGCWSTALIHPISSVSLRLKLGYYPSGKVGAELLTLHEIRKLFDGVFAQCLESFVYNGTNWGVYEFLKSRLTGPNKGELMHPITALLIGCIAAFVTNPITSPLKVVGLQIQAANNSDPSKAGRKLSYCEACAKVYQQSGLAGFWKGLGGAQLLVIDSSITFFAFERLRRRWLQLIRMGDLSPFMSFMLGGCAKMVAVLATYPIRMAKETLQAQNQLGLDSSLIGVWKKVLRQRNVQGRSNAGILVLFDGLGTELASNFIKYALRFAWKDSITAACISFASGLYSPS